MELFLDTTGNLLNIALFDCEMIANIHEDCARSQSENILPRLKEVMDQNGYQVDDIKKVIITKGPGSYTGVRIAMTLAKVLCSQKNIPLYTISTLQAYALGKEKVCTLMDARSGRAFVGFYENNMPLIPDSIMTLEEIKEKVEKEGYTCVGDAHLIGKESLPIDMNEQVFHYEDVLEHVENIHTLVPMYLKEDQAYGR